MAAIYYGKGVETKNEGSACGEIAEQNDNLFHFFGGNAGEMGVNDIPQAPGVDS
ncbi:hypothetical protein D3C73_1610150 [compost metagenome]